VTCVDTQALDASFAGRMIDEDFVRDLPPGVDPCGENGEFHSFVFDGPLFKQSVRMSVGEKVLRDERFCFCDLIPHDE
jgi:diphthamide synthase (EF-2-diphthine--ammonia ligase)